MPEILVRDYDPRWPEVFEELRSSLFSALADVATSIEHVGSTSVPGLASKPVIDMDVVVPFDRVATGIARITALGYVHRGDLGVPQREAFDPPHGAAPHHLYLCPVGSSALANHLAIRDYLRAHPSAAQAYGSLKKRLAREFAGDIDGYVEAKTGFLVAILRQMGFPEERIAEIERVNRKLQI